MATNLTMKPFTVCASVDEVIDVLGGMKAVARLTVSGVTAVYNWRKARRFPARHYLRMQSALIEREAVAPPRLWGQDGAKHFEIDNLVAA